MPRSTVRPLRPEGKLNPALIKEREKFDEKLNQHLGQAFTISDFKSDPDLSDLDTPHHEPYMDDYNGSTVTKRKLDDFGNPIDTPHSNPLLDSTI